MSRPADQTSALTAGVTVVVCTRRRPGSVTRLLTSLAQQHRVPDALFVVDASEDEQTEQAVQTFADGRAVRWMPRYWRVGAEDRGLPRQRNFALARVETDLVAFFDDDVVLAPECLQVLERTCRERPDAVGVGCVSENELRGPSAIWQLRRRLGIVRTLEPGRYCRTGLSVPWAFVEPGHDVIQGDWLPGYGMLWVTSVARAVGFRPEFHGYAQGEDLDFSLRASRHGRLLLACGARLQHLHEPAGRPDAYRLGYMELYNRYVIHRELPDRTWRDVVRFAYAWTMDTALLVRHVRDGRAVRAGQQAAGRLSGGLAVMSGRRANQ